MINTHNGYKSKNGEKIKAINIENYPSLKKHFDEFYPQLEKRADKGLTPYNLRNCAYIEEFEKEKIVWAEMTNTPSFIYENNNFFINQTCYFLNHKDNKYLLGILNSNLIYDYMKNISSNLGEGAFRWIKQYIEKLPIPKINSKNQQTADELINLVDEILKAKEKDKNTNTKGFENRIDFLVYKLYNLTEDEIRIIEGI